MNTFKFPELPKWSAMVMKGDDVTKEQAAEIIIRTSNLEFSSNDADFVEQLYRIIDCPLEEDGFPNKEDEEKAREKFGILPLVYLDNERIVSCYAYGPNGWCDWNGHIGRQSDNIGKWPDAEAVFREWTLISSAFPFLNLECQLFDGEHCEDNIKPLIQYSIANGKVTFGKPSKPLEIRRAASRDIFDISTERGCTIKQFKWALSLCDVAKRE